MSLVNKYSSLDARKRELNVEIKKLDAEQDKIREAVFSVTEKEGVDRLYGSDKMITVKEDLKLNYPKSGDKARQDFAMQMNEMGLWEVVTDLSHQALRRLAKDWPLFKDAVSQIADKLKGCDLAGFNIERYDLPILHQFRQAKRHTAKRSCREE